MPKIKFVAASVLFCFSSAMAQENPPEAVAYVNATAAGVMSPMQACVESLCPNPDATMFKMQDKIDSRMLSDLDFYRELGPKIKLAAKLDLDSSLNFARSVSRWMETASTLTDPVGIRLYNFFKYVGYFKDVTFKVSGGIPQIDESVSRAKFPQFSETEFKNMVTVVNRFYAIFSSMPVKYTDQATISLYYKEDELKNTVDETLKKLDDLSAQMTNSESTKGIMQSEDIRELFDTKDLRVKLKLSMDQAALEDLNTTYALAFSIYTAIHDSAMGTVLNTGPIDLKKSFAELQSQKFVTNRINNLADIKNDPNYGLKMLSVCADAYMTAQEVLPSAKELENFKSRSKFLKINFQNKIKKKLSVHSAGLLAKEINEKWETTYPLTREAHKALMIREIDAAIADNKKDEIDRLKLVISPERNTVMSLFPVLMRISGEGVEELGADEACKALKPEILPDAALQSKGRYTVGPLVVKMGIEAEGVSYHEMGHLLHQFMNGGNISVETSANFKRTRTCLQDMQKAMKVPSPLKFESEDYADWAASVVDQPSKNLACVFTRQLKAEDYKTLRLKVPYDAYTHSSDLYRLLNIHYQKIGSLPPTCLVAIQANGETAPFKQCK